MKAPPIPLSFYPSPPCLCQFFPEALLNLSIWHPNQSTSRRDVLSHMQKMALFKLESYWLPNFYTHAKTVLAKEAACRGLMQEYETRLCSVCCNYLGELPLNMSVRRGPCPQKRYSTRRAKRKMWQLLDRTSWFIDTEPQADSGPLSSQEPYPREEEEVLEKTSSKGNNPCALGRELLRAEKARAKEKAKSQLHMEGLFDRNFTYLRTVTPFINHTAHVTIKKASRRSLNLDFTRWALCADAYAGSPFRHHLKKQNLKVEVRLLDLWQDLQSFLRILVKNRETGQAVIRYILGSRICNLYLQEETGPKLPLQSQTIRGLKELLYSGNVNPWIPKAQEEICKMLSHCYDDFLDEEDYWFLIFSTQSSFSSSRWNQSNCVKKEENMLLYQRLQEALELSQGLSHLQEMDSDQWQSLAKEDLRQKGSLWVQLTSPVFLVDIEKMSFEELCYKYPKIAIEKMSNDYKLYCKKAPKIDIKVDIIREPKAASSSSRKMSYMKKIRKPSIRPRNLTEVLLNTQHLEFFREFLRERKAENPLQFLVAIQRISMETNEKTYNSLSDNIVKTFFHGKASPEEMLQCDTPFIKEISEMSHISTTSLLMLQNHVMKSLEEKWFKDYQDLFPTPSLDTEPEVKILPKKPSRTVMTYFQDTQKRGWMKMICFIRSFCKYRRFMTDPKKRQEFEDYLRLEVFNTKENFSSPASGRTGANTSSSRSADHENGESVLVRRRIYGHRIIVVNFAINDLYFLSEIEKFNDLVSSANVLQVNRAYNQNDILLMRAKINIILKLYLHCDTAPKLRVNISDSQKEVILAAIAEGQLSRSIFYGAIMSVFPVIMYFWKRFCSWKALRSYFHYKGKKFKDKRSPPKPVYKAPPTSGGDHPILKFTLLRGLEWFRPQQREVIPSSVQNFKNVLSPKRKRSNSGGSPTEEHHLSNASSY
ncbi:regulator of G-protein signaling protein-like isoform X2 [Erinaceus europaeus]|uniref:Regulator of G-protein signaling protein-like isoform X2 n=1 Tax=Erinaceus europaeus TaxID=9365 RepID=A0ABM3XY82_ERIEU|nr:regulator of G-protein signaling protein-like isoform X2 [Erinaceus europaeus]